MGGAYTILGGRRECRQPSFRSAGLPHRLDETVQHHLPPRLVESDGELVAIDCGDGPGAEFRVEHPPVDRKTGAAGRLRDELAFDQHRAGTTGPAAARIGACIGARLVVLRTPPAGSVVA